MKNLRSVRYDLEKGMRVCYIGGSGSYKRLKAAPKRSGPCKRLTAMQKTYNRVEEEDLGVEERSSDEMRKANPR